MPPILLDFTTHLERLGYSVGMQRMLPACIKEFLQFTGQLSLDQVTARDIVSYYGYLAQRPNRRRPGCLSEMMIHHHMYSLRVFFDYLEHLHKIQVNPLSGLSFGSPGHAAREILSPGEVQRLFGATQNLTERALLHLCYSCGLRRTEVVQLVVRDVHFRTQLLYVRRGKGAKRRVIPLTPRVSEELKLYCYHERPERLKVATDAFLVGRRGAAMQGETLRRELQLLLERAEIARDITLHSLRHSIATHLLEQGLSMGYVRDFLGHAHLESTQVYTHLQISALWNSKPTSASATP